MKKYILSNWKSILAYSFLFFWALLIYHPALKLNFLLIDDGQIIKNSRDIVDNIKDSNISGLAKIIMEPKEGRVRPAYWIVQSIFSLVSFANPTVMHLIRLLILLISCFYINKILKNYNTDLIWRFLVILLFITNFQNFENYYRLGPTEILLGLYFLIFIYQSFIKRTTWLTTFWTLVILFLGAFTKESFFLLAIPFLVLVPLIRQKNIAYLRNNFIKFSIPLMVFGICVLSIKNSYGKIAGYSLNYQITFSDMLSRFNQYVVQINFAQFPFLIIALIYFGYWLYKRKFKILRIENSKDVFLTMLFCQTLIQLLILLPWIFVLGRYLILVNISLVLIYGLALNEGWSSISNYLSKHHKYSAATIYSLRIGTLLLFVPVFMIRNIFPLTNFQLWQKTDDKLTHSILTSISKDVPNGKTVFVNYKKGDDNIEIYLETAWHLQEFFGRPDIKFIYLDDKNLCTKEDRYVFDRTAVRFVPVDIFKDGIFNTVASGSATYSPLNYGEVKKSFIQGGRAEHWDQEYKFDWRLFIQKKNTCIKLNQ